MKGIKEFFDYLSQNPDFAGQLEGRSIKEVIAAAGEKGFSVSEEELCSLTSDGALSDQELAEITGGVRIVWSSPKLSTY